MVSAATLNERIGLVERGGAQARELMRTRLRSVLARHVHGGKDASESTD